MLNLERITGNWTWLLTPLSIMGAWLNNRENKRCFFFWIMTNFCWMIVDFQAHKFNTRLLAQSAQYEVFFILAGTVCFHGKR
jgi:hypothetical protein